MTIVRRPSPFGELMSLRSAMDRLFEDSFVRHPFNAGFEGLANLPLDVTSTSDALIVEAAMPGIRPEDVDITVENGTLSIRGESRQERREGEGESLVQEIRRSSVSRTVSLPSGLEADKATAEFENGMLTLRIPKAEAVKPRQIRITPTVEGSARDAGKTASTEAKSLAASGNGSRSEPVTTGQKG